MIFKKVKQWWQTFRFYVIADPDDNSITLSKALFFHIKNKAMGEEANVFVFRVGDMYGFMTNPGIEQPTQMCNIQYNDKYRCIGFETLCPSVGQILYSYHLSSKLRVKLSVSLQKTKQGKIYYQIERPNAKHIRK